MSWSNPRCGTFGILSLAILGALCVPHETSEATSAEQWSDSASLTGTYFAVHRNWKAGYLTLQANGEFRDQSCRVRGTWSLHEGEILIDWTKHGIEKLAVLEGGRILSCRQYKFVLVRESWKSAASF